ncbi:hypothetical protein [Nocardia niigatensis]
MSFAAILKAESVAPVELCIAGRWYSGIPVQDREDAQRWLAEGGQKSTLIRVARQHGYNGSRAMFYAHSIGECCCPDTPEAARGTR